MDIFHDDQDFSKFLRMMYFVNDSNYLRNWERDLKREGVQGFEWLESWPERNELVPILAFALHKNHFHLILKQTENDGIARFVKRLAGAYTLRYNKKYNGKGGLFQGPYKSRLITTDNDLSTVFLYVIIKNVFERYPYGGIEGAYNNFEDAYSWALSDKLSSFADYATLNSSGIVQKDILADFFASEEEFRDMAYDYFMNRQEREELVRDLLLEV